MGPQAPEEETPLEDARERIIRYLQDAHAAEVGIERMLRDLEGQTDDLHLKGLYREHIEMTKSQAMRLEGRLRQLDATPSGGKGFFNSLMAKVGDLMDKAHDDYDETTRNLIKAYATEHLERGMYTAMIAFAQAAGDHETAMLAEAIRHEEEQTGEKLFPLIAQCSQSTYAAATREGGGEGKAYPL
jgi:ferritin-like metal-binding protein YciE